MAIDRDDPNVVTRRTIVKTGAKLAYAAPALAATMHLAQGDTLGVQNCACHPAGGGYVFDETPPLDGDSNPSGFVPACCTCFHCAQLGAVNPSYDSATNTCIWDTPPTATCYPLCTDVCEVVSP